MACATAEDSLAFVAAALSSLTDKEIVTKNEYHYRQQQARVGLVTGYIFSGEINVIREIEQSYANMYKLVSLPKLKKTIEPYCYEIHEEDAIYHDQSVLNYYSDPEDCTLGSYGDSTPKKMRIFNRRKTAILKIKAEKTQKAPTNESIPFATKVNTQSGVKYIPTKHTVSEEIILAAKKVSTAEKPVDQANVQTTRKPKNQLLNALLDYFQDFSKIEQIETTKELLYKNKRISTENTTENVQSVKQQDEEINKEALKLNSIQLFILSSISGKIIWWKNNLPMPSKRNSIHQLKEHIQEKLGIKVDDQCLYFKGIILEDTETIENSKITDNATVTLFHRVQGGSKPIPLYSLGSTYLDSNWDYDFTNMSDDGKVYMRGGYQYYRPYGWKRIAIKVKGMYEDDIWLGGTGIRTEQSIGEWAVTYHGTSNKWFNKICKEGLKPGARDKYGIGVYSTPDIKVAEEDYAKEFKYKGEMYKGVFQNRVNPRGMHIDNDDYHWLCEDPKNIRPYGLCIKKNN